MLELLVLDESAVKLNYCPLKRRAESRLDGPGELDLLFELGDFLGEIRVREPFFAVAVFGLELKEREDIGVDDFENAVRVGDRRVKEDVEEPGVVSCLHAGGGGDALAALEEEE